ncbi:MAG TPA: hypothetical protein VHU17_10080 [Acidimicrobiales bacterium]|jgi:hypothetical protein|nr:hypothetical protein [Acidimicrobiales bacterium]
MAESNHKDRLLWFGKKEGGLRFAPLTWQGRAATILYVFLIIVAIFTYSRLTLTAFVVAFYTVAFGLIVIYKSDLMDNWPPGSGPPGDSRGQTGRP